MTVIYCDLIIILSKNNSTLTSPLVLHSPHPQTILFMLKLTKKCLQDILTGADSKQLNFMESYSFGIKIYIIKKLRNYAFK